MRQNQRLCLEEFKELNVSSLDSIEKIAGGVLGACHCEPETNSSISNTQKLHNTLKKLLPLLH